MVAVYQPVTAARFARKRRHTYQGIFRLWLAIKYLLLPALLCLACIMLARS